jgi:hypothetical protein
LATAAEVDVAPSALDNAGYAAQAGSPDECEQRGVDSFVRFADPTSLAICSIRRRKRASRSEPRCSSNNNYRRL